MLRGFLFHLIPLLIPFVVYALYLYFSRRAGGDKTWQGKSVAVATLIGLILMAISLMALGLVREKSVDGVYIPPRFEDGKIIQPQTIPYEKD